MRSLMSRRSFVTGTVSAAALAPLAVNLDLARADTPDDRSYPGIAEHPWAGGFRSLESENDYWVEEVEGTVPADLQGTLFRNGPGRNAIGGRWFPHWFDGDGMLSAISFRQGRIHYRNRYPRTRNYNGETASGRVEYRGFGKMRPGGVIANAFRAPENVANTSVIYHHDDLLALWEGGPPTALRPSDLATLGSKDFGGRVSAFSAHPKVDPASGEMFNFGINYGRITTLATYRIDRSGALHSYPAVELPYPVMNHDFVLTEQYLVFCIGPIKVRTIRMILGMESLDGALKWDGNEPARILVMARDGSSAPRWIETPPFFQFHFANAYEDGGRILIDLARYDDFDAIGRHLREYWRSDWAGGAPHFARLAVEPSSGRTEWRELGVIGAEFPQINPTMTARKYRYAYVAATADGKGGLQQRIGKVDLETGKAQLHDFAPHGFAGEPIFVAGAGAVEEDHGYVVTLVYDASSAKSDIVILDAHDLTAKPLAVAHLRHHVPFGFHGCFTPRLFEV